MARQVIQDYKNVTLDGRKLVLNSSPRSKRQCEAVNTPQETTRIAEDVDYSDLPPLGKIPKHIMKKLIEEFRQNKENPPPPVEVPKQIQQDGQLGNNIVEVPKQIPHEDVQLGSNIVETIQQTETVDNNITSRVVESTGFGDVVGCKPLSKVTICDFPSTTTEDDLLELFDQYCPIKCKVMASGLPECEDYFTYAYIFLPSANLAEESAARLNGTIYNGAKISVKHVRIRK